MRQKKTSDDLASLRRPRLAVTLHHGGNVEDQDYPPIAQDGGAADQVGCDTLVIEGLDDQFFFAFQAVHDQTEFAISRRNYENEDLGGVPFNSVRDRLAQPDKRQSLIAKLQDFVIVNLVNRCFG
jgi:hypothetical protein